ncbi:hypothetical protein BH10ACT1_BH10ACT1_00630 [soil metagenome]
MTDPTAGTARRRIVAAAGGAALLLATVASLHLLGHGALAPPPVGSITAVRGWVAARDPITIAMAAARLLALGVAYHLVATTALAVLGRVVRRPELVRMAETATLPLLRGTVRRSAGLVLSLTAVLAGPLAPAAGSGRSAATAVAADGSGPTGPIVLERIDTVAPGSGRATLRTAPVDAAGPISAGRATLHRSTAEHLAEPVPTPGAPGARQHLVRPGDHLWAIAESVVAGGMDRLPTDTEVAPFWEAVVAANPQLVDADLLFPGDLVTVPALPGSATLHAEPQV